MASSLFLLAVFFLAICSMIDAREFLVGGEPGAWSLPSSHAASLNQWAESNRFQVGDYLVWSYDAEKDSVLQVRKKDYQSCNTSSPIAGHRDGHTRMRLRRSGAHYFISGVEGACEKGEKLVVVVMSENHRVGFEDGLAPAPAEFGEGSPAMAPVTGGAAAAAGRGLAAGAVLAFLIGGGFVGLMVA